MSSTKERAHDRGEKDASSDKGYNAPHGILFEAFSKQAREDNDAYRKGYENTKNQKEGKK